ncbi:MAG: response regulator [Deltaproteobacteria bacterium]|nr:response regulator [Deltaproteobacteria bacterium]
MHALIVDDSSSARQMAEAALDDALLELGKEAEIQIADGGVAALKILAAGEVNLLVVDLHMPDIHGIEVLNFWRSRGGKGPAIVLSTGVSEKDRDRAEKAGATAFLEKPVCADVILAVLQPYFENDSDDDGQPEVKK